MDEFELVLVDSHRFLIGRMNRSFGQACLASLAAEPETLDEFKLAFERYRKWPRDTRSFDRFTTLWGVEVVPGCKERLIIDLPARIVACEAVASSIGPRGQVFVSGAVQIPIPFCLSKAWLFLDSAQKYHAIRCQRERERMEQLQFDARSVLYGSALLDWITRSIEKETDSLFNNVSKLHCRWLTSSRTDLNGCSPQDLLLSRREAIDFDLHTRLLQSSLMERHSITYLQPNSGGYRFAGFGTYECVIYYDLVRFLLMSAMFSWTRSEFQKAEHPREARRRKNSIEKQTRNLAKLQTEWLSEPKSEYGGRIPAVLLEVERIRLPVVMRDSDNADQKNCSICRAICRETGLEVDLSFWHIDITHLESRFNLFVNS